MRVIDVLLWYEHDPKRRVLVQAVTEEGRRWLHTVQGGIRIGEALLLEAESTIEAVFATIPDTLETTTM